MKTLALAVAVVLGLAACGASTHHATKAHVNPRPVVAACPGGYVTPYGCQAHNPKVFRAAARVLPNANAAPQTTGLVTMLDSTDPWPGTPIPPSTTYVAGYVNGSYQTYRSFLGHFPVVVGISVASDNASFGGADCFDMEPGNPGPWNAGPWAHWQFSQGNTRPCEYFMLSWRSQVEQSLAQSHIPVCSSATQNFCVREWTANWTFSPHIDPGATCTQWTDHGPSGENYDQSLCYASFFKRAAPPPPPKPKDPHHYLFSPTTQKFLPGGRRGGPFASPYGNLDERLVRLEYVGAQAHPAKYRAYLGHVLEPELLFLARRVARVAIYFHDRNWVADDLGGRYQILIHDAAGKADA